MRIAWLGLTLIATVALAGCTDGLLDDEASSRIDIKLDHAANFTAEDSLDPDDRFQKVEDFSFMVDPGERDLSLAIQVTYDTENPAPVGPSGNVTVTLTHPDGERQNWSFPRSGSTSSVIDPPEAGQWGVTVRARGQGAYTVVLKARTPT